MARPLRIEYPGALYHITSRGDGREDIYLSPEDMREFLSILGITCERHTWYCYAYCLMTNHYHLLIETPLGNLSKGMRYLNGVYTQRFNKRHYRVGHVFQGRYKSILVEKENYLLELSRYIVLNPVRANMVKEAHDWQWSSYNFMINNLHTPEWLKTETILSLFGERKKSSEKAYRHFVQQGITADSPWCKLKNQIYLGSDDFMLETMKHINQPSLLTEIPKIQYLVTKQNLTLDAYQEQFNRDEAIYNAYIGGNYTMKEIGNFFNLHYSRVSKIINRVAMEKGKT